MSKPEKQVPKRRFREFVGSGEWENNQLSHIADVYDGTHQTPHYVKNGIMFLSVENINTLKSNKFISEEAFNREFKIYPQNGDILMTRIGDVGTANVVKTNIPIAYYVSLALIKSKLNPYFLQANIHSQYVQNELWKRTLHIAFPKKINKNEISNINVKYPLENEQTKIGEFFQSLDNSIALQQRKLEKAKALKAAYLAEMFPAEGENKPKRRFAGFTEPWELTKVKNIFKVTRGKVLPTSKTTPQKTKENVFPVYSSQTQNNGLLGYYNEWLFDSAITWTTDGANAGTVNCRVGKFYSTNVNGVLISIEGYANNAIAEILNKIAWKHVSKVGNPKLMNNVMAEIEITIPSLPEQTLIGNFFKKLDDTIALHQRKLEKLQQTKQAFLNEMFV